MTTFLPTSLPTNLPTYLPTFLPTKLPTNLPAYLHTYLCASLGTRATCCVCLSVMDIIFIYFGNLFYLFVGSRCYRKVESVMEASGSRHDKLHVLWSLQIFIPELLTSDGSWKLVAHESQNYINNLSYWPQALRRLGRRSGEVLHRTA